MEVGKRIASGTYGSLYQLILDGKTSVLKYFVRNEDNTFLKELDILMRIKNPHLLEGKQIFLQQKYPELFQDKNSKIAVEEELMTGNLFDLTYELKDMEPAKVEKICRKMILQLTEALGCLKQANYYHYDITPKNILFQKKDDEIDFFLADFGLCFEPSEDYHFEIGTHIYLHPFLLSDGANKKAYSVDDGKMFWMVGLSILSMLDPSYEYFSTSDDFQDVYDDLIKKNKLSEEFQKYLSRALEGYSKSFQEEIFSLMGIENNKLVSPQIPNIFYTNRNCTCIPEYREIPEDLHNLESVIFQLFFSRAKNFENVNVVFLALEYFLSNLDIIPTERYSEYIDRFLETANFFLDESDYWEDYEILELIIDRLGWNPISRLYSERDLTLSMPEIFPERNEKHVCTQIKYLYYDPGEFLTLRKELYAK